ncbi:MAG: RNA polymerase sigma factor [Pseudomonadota bacterium]
MQDPDADLIRRFAQGDARAGEQIVLRHSERVLRLARRMLNDASEAEDVAQDVFLRAWKTAPDWRPGEALFQTWLHRVTLNACYDRLRRRREIATHDAGVAVADGAETPDEAWFARQRALRVRAALAQLPERQRAAIALCHFEQASNIEAAAALEVSVDALESLLARGRRALRTLLADVGPDLIGDLGDVRRE